MKISGQRTTQGESTTSVTGKYQTVKLVVLIFEDEIKRYVLNMWLEGVLPGVFFHWDGNLQRGGLHERISVSLLFEETPSFGTSECKSSSPETAVTRDGCVYGLHTTLRTDAQVSGRITPTVFCHEYLRGDRKESVLCQTTTRLVGRSYMDSFGLF